MIFLPAHHHVLPTLPMVHTFDCPHSPAACRWFFQHIIIGTDFCHKMGVVNRDMKLENIILQVLHSVGRSISHACMHACMHGTDTFIWHTTDCPESYLMLITCPRFIVLHSPNKGGPEPEDGCMPTPSPLRVMSPPAPGCPPHSLQRWSRA